MTPSTSPPRKGKSMAARTPIKKERKDQAEKMMKRMVMIIMSETIQGTRRRGLWSIAPSRRRRERRRWRTTPAMSAMRAGVWLLWRRER